MQFVLCLIDYAMLLDFLDSVSSSVNTQGLKTIGYHVGNKDSSWCKLCDGSMTQGSLCLFCTAMVRVGNRLRFYYFLNFLC